MQTGVGCRRGLSRRQPVTRRDNCSAGEQIERHVLVLQADPGAAKIALVDVLPEADVSRTRLTLAAPPRLPAVLVDELDAGRFQCVANGLNQSLA